MSLVWENTCTRFSLNDSAADRLPPWGLSPARTHQVEASVV